MLRRRATHDAPRRVVVIGASLAGAFAAAAAAGPGRTVTLVERDVLPESPRPRDGVPQGRHPHAILRRGLLAVEEMLPGFEAELRDAGAVPLDTGDVAWLADAGWGQYGRPQFGVLAASRPLFEHLALRRVRVLPGVRVRDGVRVDRLRRGDGAPGSPRWWVDLDDGSVEGADLVVDAAGRASRLPAWLDEAGVTPAPVTHVDARIGYATRQYVLPPGRHAGGGVVVLATPGDPRGGIAVPMEGGRWLVGVVGAGEHRPPRDPDGFTAFAGALRDPAIAEIAAAGEPRTDVAVHRQTANRRHHYDRVRDWPAGLLVVGDALCAFNPIYGQGVTVAAQEALLLRRTLRRGWRPGDERRLLRAFRAVLAVPWGIATGEDRRFPTSSGARPTRAEAAMSRWGVELGRLAAHGDTLAADTTARVYHLMGPPWLLVRPGLVLHALRARVRGYGPPNPRPPVLRPAQGDARATPASP